MTVNDIKKAENILAENVLPPHTNRGADNTSESGLRACVDWVQATLKIVDVTQLITDILKLDLNDFYEAENGKFGYKNSKRFGHIAIYYNGNEDMGIHLEMSGQGCREYELLNKRSWKNLFSCMLEYEANFTRLDIAIDDFKEYFSIPQLVRKIKDRQLVSKFKNATKVENINIETGESEGNTIYYGGSASRIQIRMYEKNHERMGKGYTLEDGIKTWNRTEVQARKERAAKIAALIASEEEGNQSIGKLVSGILKYYLRFTVKGKDRNRSRWKTAPFWEKFLGDVEALRLTEIAPDRTIEKTDRWLYKQVAPSLAAMLLANDGDMDLLKDYIENGKKRLKDKDYAMIDRYKKEMEEREDIIKNAYAIH